MMHKGLILSILLATSLMGRDNPFFSTEENAQNPLSSNKTVHKPLMTSLSYSFPDHARVLKEATFTFQNVDGSIETRRIEIDQSIDWHVPLILSHSASGKTASDTTGSSNANFDFIRFNAANNRLTVTSSDSLVRYFSQNDPAALVLDFQHKAPFSSKAQNLSGHPYSKVRVSNHGKFARATITLDGHYSCTITPSGQDTIITCK